MVLKKKFGKFTGIYKTLPLEVAHSGHKRTRKTAELLTDSNERETTDVDVRFSGEVRDSLKEVSSKALDEVYEKLVVTGDESAGVQMIIDTGNKRYPQ